jgi:hypothetical protein
VRLDGLGDDDELVGDSRVAAAARDELEDLAFTRGEAGHSCGEGRIDRRDRVPDDSAQALGNGTERPAATTLIPCRSSSAVDRLSRNPLAPEARAS